MFLPCSLTQTYLFWRQEPGVDLSVTSEPDWQHGLHLYQAYDRDAGAKDVKDGADAVAKLPECSGRVAVLGYCLGGLMTFLTAVRYGVDASQDRDPGGDAPPRTESGSSVLLLAGDSSRRRDRLA
jgi:dienelactone hydrolase